MTDFEKKLLVKVNVKRAIGGDVAVQIEGDDGDVFELSCTSSVLLTFEIDDRGNVWLDGGTVWEKRLPIEN